MLSTAYLIKPFPAWAARTPSSSPTARCPAPLDRLCHLLVAGNVEDVPEDWASELSTGTRHPA